MAEKYYVEVNDYCTYWYAWPGEGRKLHRLDGPAIECSDGYRSWWQNDQRHSTDGPAVVNADGSCEWWLNGTRYTQDAWRAAKQPAVEMTVAEIEALLGKRIKIVK